MQKILMKFSKEILTFQLFRNVLCFLGKNLFLVIYSRISVHTVKLLYNFCSLYISCMWLEIAQHLTKDHPKAAVFVDVHKGNIEYVSNSISAEVEIKSIYDSRIRVADLYKYLISWIMVDGKHLNPWKAPVWSTRCKTK